MINRSDSPKRSFRAFGLALVASLAVAGLLASSASALSISPSSGTAGGSGSFATFQAAGGPTYSCTSSSDIWSWSGGTNGQLDTTLVGCRIEYFGIISNCNSAGQASGVIKLNKLNFTPVYLDAAKTKFGYKLSPASGSVVTEFTCAGFEKFQWTGSILGQIIEPALNVSSKRAKLRFTASGSTQTYQQIEGAGTSYHLSSSSGGGSPVSLGLTQDHTIESSVAFTYVP